MRPRIYLDVSARGLLVAPLEKKSKRGPTVTIIRLLFCREFGERLLNLRKTKQRIVSESIHPARSLENDALGYAAKCGQRLAISRSRQHAHKPSRTSLRRNVFQFAQHACIVLVIVCILLGEMRPV